MTDWGIDQDTYSTPRKAANLFNSGATTFGFHQSCPSIAATLSRRVLFPAALWRCIVACRTVSTAAASRHQTAAHPTRQAPRASEAVQFAYGRTRT